MSDHIPIRGSSRGHYRGSLRGGFTPRNTLRTFQPPDDIPQPRGPFDFPPSISPTPEPVEPTQAPTAKKKVPQLLDYSIPQTFVTLIVDKGDSQKTFYIHKCLLGHYSPFFEKAFNGPFVEGQTQSMTIGDIDSSAFGLLVQSLHTRKLAVDVENAFGPGLLRLAKAWVLAERFLMPKIQNAIVRSLHYSLTRCAISEPDFIGAVNYTYANETLKESPIRTILSDCYALTMRDKCQGDPDLPVELLKDAVKILGAINDHQNPRNRGYISKIDDYLEQDPGKDELEAATEVLPN